MTGVDVNSTMQRVLLQPYYRGKSTEKGKNDYANTRMVDFSWGKLVIWSYFRGWEGVGRGILLYRHFYGGKFYYGKIVIIFPGEGRGGTIGDKGRGVEATL